MPHRIAHIEQSSLPMARRSTRKRKAIESETVKPVKPETPADRLPAPENPVAKEQPAAENADTPNKEVRKKKRRRKQKPQTATEASNVLQNDKGFLPDTTVMKDEKDEEELELEELVFGGDVEGKFDEVLRKVGHEVEVKADDDDHWAVGFESGEEGPTGDGLVESEDDEVRSLLSPYEDAGREADHRYAGFQLLH